MNRPEQNDCNTVRGRLISTSCPKNSQRTATAQIYPSIPLQTETRTEGGRQVVYFRFTPQPESENECKKDEEECDLEKCKCSPSKEEFTLDKKEESEETGECDQDKCKCSPQNSKEDLTAQEEEEEKDNGFSWWKCDKPDCDCQKSNKQTFEFDNALNACTFMNQNGMKIVIPCHHCFTFEDENAGQRQRTNTRVGRQLEQASNPASTSSYYVANVQNIECGNMKMPKWEKRC